MAGLGIAPQTAIVPGTISAVVSNVSSAAAPSIAGIARNTSGDMYIATYDNLIKKVSSGGTIATYAGTGSQCPNQTSVTSPCGDGGSAITATFRQPYSVALDSSNNLYIADAGTQRVRKVDANGTITTVAGNGISCANSTDACGDGGYALNANLNSPNGITLDSKGNLFIADSANNRARRVDPNGIITTIAGTGIPGSTGDNGAATAATLNQPTGIAVDAAGNVYIGEATGKFVRRVDALTGIIINAAGAGDGGTSLIPGAGIPGGQAGNSPFGSRVGRGWQYLYRRRPTQSCDKNRRSDRNYTTGCGHSHQREYRRWRLRNERHVKSTPQDCARFVWESLYIGLWQ